MHKEFQQWFFHGAAEVDATPPAPVTTDNFVIIQPSNCISNIVQIVHGSDKFCSSSGGQDHDSSQQIVTKEEDPYISKDKQSSVCETLNWYTLESQKRRLVYDLYPKVHAYIHVSYFLMYCLPCKFGFNDYNLIVGTCLSWNDGGLTY